MRGDGPTETYLEAIRALQEATACWAIDGADVQIAAPLLRGRLAIRQPTVDLAASDLTRDTVRLLLTHGWTPGDLLQFCGKRLDAVALSYLADAITAASQATVAPPWQDELGDLGLRVWWSVAQPHLTQWATRHGIRRLDSICTVVEVLALVGHLPRTAEPVPGAPALLAVEPGTLVLDERIAGKIDALLAKAGGTDYPDEAAACASKAQELMLRYASVPDVPMEGPLAAIAAAVLDQLAAEGPAVAAKLLVAGVRTATSMLMDVGQRLIDAFLAGLPALPGRALQRAVGS